jgi:hypothetical protein
MGYSNSKRKSKIEKIEHTKFNLKKGKVVRETLPLGIELLNKPYFLFLGWIWI